VVFVTVILVGLLGGDRRAAGAALFEVGLHAPMGCVTFVGLAYPMERGPDGWAAGETHSISIALPIGTG
jgi:hypothetical protein